MNVLIKNKPVRIALIVLFFFISFTGINADIIRVNVGVWMGDQDSELEERFFFDDLIAGTQISRINLDWTGKSDTVIYPLGFQYIKPFKKSDFIFRANYYWYNPSYKFIGLNKDGAGLSIITLDDYLATNMEADAGYKFLLLDKKLSITPRLGYRSFSESFNFNELSFATNYIAISMESPWEATARGFYAGIGLGFKVLDGFELTFDYLSSFGIIPPLSGPMKHERLIIGKGPVLQYDNATAEYQVDMRRWALGVFFDVSKSIHVFGGFQYETLIVSYPGYFNLSIPRITPGTSISGPRLTREVIAEFLIDNFSYAEPKSTEKGTVYFGAAYDFEF